MDERPRCSTLHRTNTLLPTSEGVLSPFGCQAKKCWFAQHSGATILGFVSSQDAQAVPWHGPSRNNSLAVFRKTTAIGANYEVYDRLSPDCDHSPEQRTGGSVEDWKRRSSR